MTEVDPIVTMADVRRSAYCARGAKTWFELHDLDFRAFLRDGLPASVLLATGDEMARRVVEQKKAASGG